MNTQLFDADRKRKVVYLWDVNLLRSKQILTPDRFSRTVGGDFYNSIIYPRQIVKSLSGVTYRQYNEWLFVNSWGKKSQNNRMKKEQVVKNESKRSEDEFFTTCFAVESYKKLTLTKDIKYPGAKASKVLHAVGIALQHFDLIIAAFGKTVSITMLI